MSDVAKDRRGRWEMLFGTTHANAFDDGFNSGFEAGWQSALSEIEELARSMESS